MDAKRPDYSFISVLSRIGNLMIVSFFWCMTVIFVVTLIPSCAALYHTTVTIIRGSGSGVARDYFSTLKSNFRQGALLSIGCIVVGLLLYTALDFGFQMSAAPLGLAYFIVGLMLCLAAAGTFVFLAPALSRFNGRALSILRLAAYLALANPGRVVYMLALFALVVFCVWFFPLLILLLPGVYYDLICPAIEKSFAKYMKVSGLAEQSTAETTGAGHRQAEEPESAEMTALEQAAKYAEDDDQDNRKG